MLDELLKLTSKCTACVVYNPIRDEIDFMADNFPVRLANKQITIPPHNKIDPFISADDCKINFFHEKVFILIPGKEFDDSGTRIGRGGGWYDRFLLKIPLSWIKIGLTNARNLSKQKLPRKSTDMPVDWIIVKRGKYWDCIRSN